MPRIVPRLSLMGIFGALTPALSQRERELIQGLYQRPLALWERVRVREFRLTIASSSRVLRLLDSPAHRADPVLFRFISRSSGDCHWLGHLRVHEVSVTSLSATIYEAGLKQLVRQLPHLWWQGVLLYVSAGRQCRSEHIVVRGSLIYPPTAISRRSFRNCRRSFSDILLMANPVR